MLKEISIINFALIDTLKVSFLPGMTSITGETGAGKSIILGALSLVLGKRADSTYLKNPEKKCIVEATINISHYNLKEVFDSEDIDLYCLHQGSAAIVDVISKRFDNVSQRFVKDMANTGNTVSSSIPLLSEKVTSKKNMNRILISGFGVGLSIATAIISKKDRN